MKILHIISSGEMYGAEAVILNLSRTLNEAGHSSILGVFSNSANPNLQLHSAATLAEVESHLIPCQGQVDIGVPNTDASIEKGSTVIPVGLKLPVDSLAPGSYQLRLKALDSVGNSSPVRSCDFEVE